MKGLKTLVAVQVAALFAFAALFAYVVQGFEQTRESDCRQTLDAREQATENDVALWRDVQDIAFNDPEDAPYFDELFARIRARAEALPPPATCED